MAGAVEFARLQEESLSFLNSNQENDKAISPKFFQEVPMTADIQSPLLPTPSTNIQRSILPTPSTNVQRSILPTPSTNTQKPLLPNPPTKAMSIPLTKFQPENIRNVGHIPTDVRAEKIAKGLCYFCDQPYDRQHKCQFKESQLFTVEIQGGDGEYYNMVKMEQDDTEQYFHSKQVKGVT